MSEKQYALTEVRNGLRRAFANGSQENETGECEESIEDILATLPTVERSGVPSLQWRRFEDTRTQKWCKEWELYMGELLVAWLGTTDYSRETFTGMVDLPWITENSRPYGPLDEVKVKVEKLILTWVSTVLAHISQEQKPVVTSLDEFKRIRGQAWVSMTDYHEDSGFDEGFWDKFYDLLVHGYREPVEGGEPVGWVWKYLGDLHISEAKPDWTDDIDKAKFNVTEVFPVFRATPPSSGQVREAEVLRIVEAFARDTDYDWDRARKALAAPASDNGVREEVDRSSDLWDSVYNYVADCECGNRGPSDTTDIIVGLLTPAPKSDAVREAGNLDSAAKLGLAVVALEKIINYGDKLHTEYVGEYAVKAAREALALLSGEVR